MAIARCWMWTTSLPGSSLGCYTAMTTPSGSGLDRVPGRRARRRSIRPQERGLDVVACATTGRVFLDPDAASASSCLS